MINNIAKTGAKNGTQMLKDVITDTLLKFSTERKLEVSSKEADKFVKTVYKELLVKITIDKVKKEIEAEIQRQEQIQSHRQIQSHSQR
ncbi:hypothetical protein [Clostridium lacusfryxellense]|uniref:hypothetical protein n=1 Tax=Clostridium lacusfryxellense TaxID=205328 RepID=UPI001C0B4836|nr:hypothetical protein [Clostridium lacusfryxellense]MBU3110304.1 hypothetical protein [Clostridium lacusfryxellense]